MEYMYLTGSEDVRSAGNTMVKAAESMQSAASTITEAFAQHQRFLDNWLRDLETVLNEHLR